MNILLFSRNEKWQFIRALATPQNVVQTMIAGNLPAPLITENVTNVTNILYPEQKGQVPSSLIINNSPRLKYRHFRKCDISGDVEIFGIYRYVDLYFGCFLH